MITKFRSCEGVDQTVEFERSGKENINITIEDVDANELLLITISKHNLFSLIGQLLRIQSEIRSEASNG